ncbi:uncharacterized protein KY384_001615 [Bacidia gigantensis]|uniref:uncharacterized protein n=1 Tax=Bacidia gigantensis TaxID=2732470 RepID=UPI001D03F243|nr:uncharacterized protein KY384_001615 [Bacidia gigantensis]KAG8533874.1 hypothetical protein KY384_001615 [Bacidia gigantensis]
MIQAIFFATFDVNEGPKVHHQVPPNSVHPTKPSSATRLFNFPELSSYIIPAPALSNRPLELLTPGKPSYRILSHPVTIKSPSYPRNAFTFNFSLVLAENIGFHSYLPVVHKLATLFRHLEEESRFLSTELKINPQPNTGRIHAICELLLEDLNTYSECMIPVDGTTTTLNIKLFPLYPTPPRVEDWQVPLLTVNLEDMKEEECWDLTLLQVLPHIDGVNSIKRISTLADADSKLVRKAIRELVYYGCTVLLDIFTFSAIYAPTESIGNLVTDVAMQDECLHYITIPSFSTTTTLPPPTLLSPSDTNGDITPTRLIELYTSLSQGQSLKTWILSHGGETLVKTIDIRRFITFGVIKGFLYRVHRYAAASDNLPSSKHKSVKKGKGLLQQQRRQETQPLGQKKQGKGDGAHDENHDEGEMQNLAPFLDGTHCFDKICTDLGISERELMARLKKYGNVQIICR